MDFRHELVLPDEDLPFKLFVFEGKDGSYQVSRHWHRSVEIFLVLEGSLDFYINTQRYRMEPGRLLLVNSNEVHSIDSPDANNTLVLQIPRGLFEKYLPDADSLAFRQFLWEPGKGCAQGSRELRAASLIVQMHKA